MPSCLVVCACWWQGVVEVVGSGEFGRGSGIGGLVRARRRAAGWTQEELAGRAGVSVGALRDLEQGRTRRPRSGLVARLAEVLDLSGGQVEKLADDEVLVE